MSDFNLYCLPEELSDKDYLIATYYCEFPVGTDIVKKAGSIAVGQTVGTWIPVPGITDEMRERHMGRVVNIYDVPPSELDSRDSRAGGPPDGTPPAYAGVNFRERLSAYLIEVAFPTVNFGPDFPMMFTTLFGNDASTSTQAKLVELRMPKAFAEGFGGPNLGPAGVRRATGVYGRPLLMSMIKPCTGLTPEAGAEIFYNAAIGGLDIVKDDELLGDASFSPVVARVNAYEKAADRVYEKTGHRPLYIVNITGHTASLIERARAVIDAGAKGVMASCAAVGYSAFRGLANYLKDKNVLLMGHYASTGMLFEGPLSGMGSHLAVGRFPRLAGADLMMINTPYGGYPLRYEKYMKTVHHLTLPFYDIKPTLPVIGGGVHPGLTEQFIEELGSDIMLAAGGAVHGHPMGPAAGAAAMRQSIDAAVSGVPLDEAAASHRELAKALEQWGYVKKK
ncbi:MAG: transcriptional regulator [Clostridiales Family XIII bacterium]|jgi:2,3-diketo-5-methylthiopentyl-1-phosphate enolase|nr:transcriptional regulator [Clostridiales Family XIII bacterium]